MSKENLNQRIKRLRKAQRYTQKELAKYINVSHGTISQWESEITSPKGSHIQPLAKALKVSVMELLQGTGFASDSEQADKQPGQLPLLTLSQAAVWKDNIDDRQQSGVYERFTINAKLGPNAFAVKMAGDSMASYSGGRSIPAGSIVIADPDIEPSSGKIVIARLNDTDEATIKELVSDAGMTFLKSFNASFPTIAINDNCKIVAVVKQVIQEF